MSVFDDVLAANARYAEGFGLGSLPVPPAKHLAVLCCMDARILPLEVFGLAPGDAHVIRNAGGRASDDALRSLLVSTHKLGVRSIAVVHHTHCGMAGITDDGFRAELRETTGHDPGDLPVLAIVDADQAIKEDVASLAWSPLFPPGTEVAGFVYDVETGRLDMRVPPTRTGA